MAKAKARELLHQSGIRRDPTIGNNVHLIGSMHMATIIPIIMKFTLPTVAWSEYSAMHYLLGIAVSRMKP